MVRAADGGRRQLCPRHRPSDPSQAAYGVFGDRALSSRQPDSQTRIARRTIDSAEGRARATTRRSQSGFALAPAFFAPTSTVTQSMLRRRDVVGESESVVPRHFFRTRRRAIRAVIGRTMVGPAATIPEVTPKLNSRPGWRFSASPAVSPCDLDAGHACRGQHRACPATVMVRRPAANDCQRTRVTVAAGYRYRARRTRSCADTAQRRYGCASEERQYDHACSCIMSSSLVRWPDPTPGTPSRRRRQRRIVASRARCWTATGSCLSSM